MVPGPYALGFPDNEERGMDATDRIGRPLPVTAVAVLVVLTGLVVIGTGVALVVERGNEILQLPALLARVDEALPFDNGQDLDTYLAGVGVLVAVAGLLLSLLGLGIARGMAIAYVATLVVLGALSAGAGLLRERTTDDLALLSVTVLGVTWGALFVVTLALLIGRRSRAWVLGRRTPV